MRIPAAVALSAALSLNVSLPLLAASTGNTSSSITDRIRQKQIEVEVARKQLAEKRGQLRVRQMRSQDLQNQLQETNSSITRVSDSLNVLGGEIHFTQRKLDWNQRLLDAAQATLKRHNDALNRRLVDAYERGDMGYVNVLLSANSFSDFVERWDDIRYLIAANQKTVRERRDAERTVATVQRELERQRLLLSDTMRREQQDKFQLAALADEREQLVAVAEQNRRSVAREVAQLEELTAAQEASLEQLIREKQLQEEARREAARRAAKLSGHELPPETHVGAPATFSWPVSGPITSPFGMRADPFGHGFRKHSGIDIGAPMSATITAAAAGRVIMAHWYGGYGNAIIIDHGGKTSTLYGHCSQIFVSEGQDVQRGQAIGAVGSTGNSTGPHLHFEVRVNGVPVDPIGRLR